MDVQLAVCTYMYIHVHVLFVHCIIIQLLLPVNLTRLVISPSFSNRT